MKKIILLCVVAVLFLVWVTLPNAGRLKDQYPWVKYTPAKKTGQKITTPSSWEMEWSKTPPAHWRGLKSISRSVVGAVLVSEDWDFYQHNGFDIDAMTNALEEAWKEKHWVRGGSTLSQQVAKNVFLNQNRSLWRKVREAYLTWRMEQQVSKRKILETYLNIAEWGEGVFGIQAAARHYFQKSADAITPREAAFLAMLLPSPKKYSASYRKRGLTPFARRRVAAILLRMQKAGFMSAETRLANQGPLGFEATSKPAVVAPSPALPVAEGSTEFDESEEEDATE